ncbi:hypothetical protein [Anaerostipes faecis]|uniref:hypothetical protein n=1 Tax=Anaerostipes faecis TaxID=2880702 RepID=UPI0011DDF211|nr:hypothetical protein [Anaerostipes faecis]
MKKKTVLKISVTFILSSLVIILGNIYTREKTSKNITRVEVSAKTDEYANLQQVEQASDLIVEGIKTDEEENVVQRDENGELLATYTLSTFKVEKVNKTSKNKSYDIITILENEAYDENTRSIYHINGYKKMKPGKRYLLMLQKTEKNYYVPTGVNYGKIAISNRDNEIYTNDNSMKKEIKEIQNSAVIKYKFGVK